MPSGKTMIPLSKPRPDQPAQNPSQARSGQIPVTQPPPGAHLSFWRGRSCRRGGTGVSSGHCANMLIPLTQVMDEVASGHGTAGFSEDVAGVSPPLCRTGGVPGIFVGQPLAGRFQMPAVWSWPSLAAEDTRALPMPKLRTPTFTHCRDRAPSQPLPGAGLVLGGVFGEHSHPGIERATTPTADELQLQDRLVFAPSPAPGDGST
jgi:hypothetical protein